MDYEGMTNMLKLVMKAVFGRSTSKNISFDELPLFRALVVMTVWAKRDATLQSTLTLCTSICPKKKQGVSVWSFGKLLIMKII